MPATIRPGAGAAAPLPASTSRANSRYMRASPPCADRICAAVSRDCALSLPPGASLPDAAAYAEEGWLLPSPLAAFPDVGFRRKTRRWVSDGLAGQ